jgi:hypothetical protein
MLMVPFTFAFIAKALCADCGFHARSQGLHFIHRSSFCGESKESIMHNTFHRLLQFLQIAGHQILRRLSHAHLSSHRAQHMH